MKFSKQRELILNAIKDNKVHPTADFIYEYLKKDNPNLSLGTVYRNLSQLVEHGFIRKVSIAGCPDRFDYELSNHYHMLCEKCGGISDISSEILNHLTTIVGNELDLEIKSCNINFKGICNKCKYL